jgi:hypothetical protein
MWYDRLLRIVKHKLDFVFPSIYHIKQCIATLLESNMAKKSRKEDNIPVDNEFNWNWKANDKFPRKFYVVFGHKSVPCMALDEEEAAITVLAKLIGDVLRKRMNNQEEEQDQENIPQNSLGGVELPADVAVSESGPFSPSELSADFKKGDYNPFEYKEIKAYWNSGHEPDKMFRVPELLPKITSKLQKDFGGSCSEDGFDDACGT